MIRTIKQAITFAGSFLTAQWRQYNPTGQMLFVLALVAMAVDATISWEYGMSMSPAHAAGYALIAIAMTLFPDIAASEFEKGSKGNGTIFTGLCMALAVVAYQSHIGYGSGIRLGDMQQTKFHNAKLESEEAGLKSEGTNLDLWRQQRKALADERAALVKDRPFVTTVTAEALRASLPVLDKKIAAEAAGGRGGRKAGCKAECEKLNDEKVKVTEQIANVEMLNGVTAQLAALDAKIDSTQRVIDKKVAQVAETGFKSSTVVNQNTALGDLWQLVSGKEPPAKLVSLATMGTTSLAFLLLAPAFMYGAGRNRIKQGDSPDAEPTHATLIRQPMSPEPQKLHMLTTTKTIDNTDYTHRDTLAALVRRLETAKAA